MNERIKWIDVVKAFGIFIVYLGHFGWQAGRAYTFVFTHNVALFFFVAGCMENFNKEENFLKYLVKKLKTLLLPCYFFAFSIIAVMAISSNAEWYVVKEWSIKVLQGLVRNQFIAGAGAIWFLTCLFVMQIMFFIIKKLRYKAIILLMGFGMYFAAATMLPTHPIVTPSWYYNIDSALYYIIYYALGYIAFPYIVQLFELDTTKKKVIYGVTGVLAIIYTIRFFFGMDLLSYVKIPVVMNLIGPILVPCIMIWAYFVVARFLEDAAILADIGKNTLYLCGSEYIIKIIIENMVLLFGIKISVYDLSMPLVTYIYVCVLLVLANRYLVPVEKYIIRKLIR